MVPSIVTYAVALAIVLLVVKLIGKSIKMIFGILVNSLIGFVVFFILNAFALGVQINIVSAILVAILGIPGLIIVIALQLGLGMLIF